MLRKKKSQLIFLLNHRLARSIVIQQRLWLPGCWSLPVSIWTHLEILPSPQQGWPSEVARVFCRSINLWAGSRSECVWWGHKIVTSRQPSGCQSMASELDDEWRVCGLVVFKKSGSTSWRLLVKPSLKKQDFYWEQTEVKLISFMISLSLYDTITYNMYDMFCFVTAL